MLKINKRLKFLSLFSVIGALALAVVVISNGLSANVLGNKAVSATRSITYSPTSNRSFDTTVKTGVSYQASTVTNGNAGSFVQTTIADQVSGDAGTPFVYDDADYFLYAYPVYTETIESNRNYKILVTVKCDAQNIASFKTVFEFNDDLDYGVMFISSCDVYLYDSSDGVVDYTENLETGTEYPNEYSGVRYIKFIFTDEIMGSAEISDGFTTKNYLKITSINFTWNC